MRSLILAALAALSMAAPAAGGVITGFHSSLYVLGDSMSDDGNINGTIWRLITGGSPYHGNWRDGGTFTNGDVWNEALQNDFRKAGHDADNFAVGKARSSGGSWLLPNLDRQIDKLLDETSRRERGPRPLVSIWIGANNVIDALTDGDDAVAAAVSAAKQVVKGARKLATKAGVEEFVVFNMPKLGNVPQYRLFEKDKRTEATEAARAYNRQLSAGIRSLESDGLNVVDINVYRLLNEAIADPARYGFGEVKLPCVFPSNSTADRYDQRRRCSSSTAKERLFIDGLHVNAQAHRIIGDLVESQLEADILARRAMLAGAMTEPEPVPNPLPPPAALLLGALGVLAVARRRAARRLV